MFAEDMSDIEVAMETITLSDLEAAAGVVAAHMPATPLIRWPLLAARTGADVWVKHENHTAIGAFKIRGGLNFLAKLKLKHVSSSSRREDTKASDSNSSATSEFSSKTCTCVPGFFKNPWPFLINS